MFYRFDDDLTTVDIDEIDKNHLTAGYVTSAQFDKIGSLFSVPSFCAQLCKTPPAAPKPFVELFDDLTFLFLATPAADDSVSDFDIAAVFVWQNLIVVVDVKDSDCSTRNAFLSALSKYPLVNVSLEKLLAAFLSAIISDDFKSAEKKSFEISRLEELVLSEKAGKNFNSGLLKIKRELLLMQNYYEHLIDIGEALEENEIFSKKEIRCISGFTQRARRLREDADSLQNAVMHLQDSYQSSLDLKLNNTMNFFTVITAVFFPLTVIVGWYGMNFDSMPEVRWKYGYAFVIALSVGVVSLLLFAVKRRRWL